jgi:hypothetical protein
MVPPLDVILEVSNQLIRCREHVGAFLAIEMPVITLADFIIVAQNTVSMHNIRQSVFEPVRRSFDRLWKTPQYQFRERRLIVSNARANEFYSFHVGYNTNIGDRCQSLQQQESKQGAEPKNQSELQTINWIALPQNLISIIRGVKAMTICSIRLTRKFLSGINKSYIKKSD